MQFYTADEVTFPSILITLATWKM